MHTQYVISVTSRDQVGIVADVAQAISDLKGDIADIRQSVLHGYFTMILLATFPSDVSTEMISGALQTPSRYVNVQPSNDLTPPTVDLVPDNAYVLTASGTDRIGFVASVATFCAQHNINILDLSTTQSTGKYIMMLLVDLSDAEPLVTVRWHMQRFAEEKGFHLVLQHHDIFKATNEVS